MPSVSLRTMNIDQANTTSPSHTVSSILSLPSDVLTLIYHYLATTSLLTLRSTHRILAQPTRSARVWSYAKLTLYTSQTSPIPPSLYRRYQQNKDQSLVNDQQQPAIMLQRLYTMIPYLTYLDLTHAWSPHELDIPTSLFDNISLLSYLRILMLPLLISEPPTNSQLQYLANSLPHLSTLIVNNCRDLNNFHWINSLPNLHTLTLNRLRSKIFNSQTFDIMDNNIDINITHLTLDFTAVESLLPLSSLCHWSSLQSLHLQHAQKIPTQLFNAIAILPHLSTISLTRCTVVDPLTAFSALASAPSLRHIAAPFSPVSIAALLLMPQLISVRCNHQHGCGDSGLSVLATLKQLKSFSSHGGGLIDQRYTDDGLAGLSQCPQLTHIKLLFCRSITGRAFYTNNIPFKSLISLQLNYCGIDDEGLKAISLGCSQLETLLLKFTVYVYTTLEEQKQTDTIGRVEAIEQSSRIDIAADETEPPDTDADGEIVTNSMIDLSIDDDRNSNMMDVKDRRMPTLITEIGFRYLSSLCQRHLTSFTLLYHPCYLLPHDLPSTYLYHLNAFLPMFQQPETSVLTHVHLIHAVITREMKDVIQRWKQSEANTIEQQQQSMGRAEKRQRRHLIVQ